MCGRMFPKESDEVEKYVDGFPDMIQGSVMTSKPKTMKDAIKFATKLMDQKISFQKEKYGKGLHCWAWEKKVYGGSKPLCPKCNYHHDGQCAPKCTNCKRTGLLAQDYRSPAAAANNQRAPMLGLKDFLMILELLLLRNKADLDTMSMDDLYNNLKVYEPEVKGVSSSNSSTQNIAFVSSSNNNTSSSNEAVNAAHEVTTASTQVNTAYSTNIDNLSDAVICSLFASQPNSPQLAHEDLQQIHFDDIEEMDLRWKMAILTMRARSSRRSVPVETSTSTALVSCDGLGGYDWSDQAKEGPNYALMAYSSLSSDSKDIQVGEITINELRKKLEKLQKEKDSIQFNVDKFENASKSLDKLIEFQIVDNCKKGLGYEKYNAVPPPHIGNFMPSTPDLSFTCLDEFVSDSEEENVYQPKTEKKTVKPGIAKIEFIKPKQQEKTARKTIKQAKKHRQNTHSNPQMDLHDKGVIDSGCSRHMTGNMSHLIDYEEIDGGYVAFRGNPKGGKIIGKGTIKLLIDESQVLLRVPRKNNMYSVDLKNIVPKRGLTCLFAKATSDESKLWHRRLGHLNFKTMNKLVKGNLVRGLPSKLFENDETCVACQKGKQHRASCKTKIKNSISLPLHLLASCKTKTENSISLPLHLFHMDLFGPTFVKSLMKKMYCLVVIDDYSRFTWVFFLATKDETSGILKSFITGIENLVDHKNGILRQFSVSRTPQQNGVTERRNRKLIEAARTMLADSKLPTTFWAEAVNTACYVQNKVLVVKPHNKTPYELFHGRTPTLSFMRPFGCPVTILNNIDHLGKFDGKADEGFFVGYSLNSKAFRVFNSRTRIVEKNLHIRFSESTPNVAGSGPDWLFDIDALTRTMNYEPIVAGTQSNGFAGTKASDNAGQARKETEPVKDYILLPLWTADPPFSQDLKSSHDDGSKPSSDNGKKVDEDLRKDSESNDQEKEDNVNSTNNVNAASTNEVNVVGGKTSIKLPDDPNMHALEDYSIFDFIRNDEEDDVEADMNNLDTTIQVSPNPTTRIHKDHPLDQVIRDLQSATQTRNMLKNLKEHGFVSTIQQRTNHKDLQYCLFACFLSQEEPKKLQEVWTLLDLPNRKRAIGTKWVFRNKKDERGIVIRNKARLVAQGYTQEEGIDYDEVFAPFARIEAIRLFLAYASFKDFIVYQMDVKSAFLYGKIEEEVYVCKPPGFEDPDFPNRVYKVYVDDIIFGSTKKELCNAFKNQDKYVGEILKKFGFTEVKTASTPMETQKPLLKDKDGEEVDVHMYRSMIGSLMYLTSSRPDIMFAVCAYARYQVNPKVSHLYAVKRIFRYLKGQPKLGLWYPKDSPFDLVAYTDSDYAGASLDRKSTTGGCQFLRSRLISWQCKKQTVVANSITKAEYVAASSCCGQVLWIQNQLLDYGYNFMHTKIFIDNNSTIFIIKNPVFHSKTKHIEIRHHFIRDCNEKKLIQMVKIHTDKNVADLLTKAFDVKKAKKSVILMMEKLVIRENRQRVLVRKKIKRIDEVVNEEMDDSLERAATTATSLDAEQDRGGGPRCQETIGDIIAQTRFENISKTSNDPLLARGNTLQSGEDRLKLEELMALCTNLQQRVLDLETTKTTQANEIASLKRRVKKLERRNKSRTHRLKRMYKVGSSRRVNDWFQKPTRLPSPDHAWNTSVPAVHETVQPWLSSLAQQDPRESFDELTDSTFDFSAFVLNRLNVQTLTPELLAGPTFELMKGTCKSLTELEYFCEEVYKATTEKLDWINPEGRQYPHDLRQPLPLVPNSQGRRVIPFHHFINNDLEYLRGGVSSRKYSTSVTKTKAADYGHIKWIEDLVPNSMWSQTIVKYDKFALWGISHWGKKRRQFYAFATLRESARDYEGMGMMDDSLHGSKKGDFTRLRIQDIEDMLLRLVYKEIVIQRRVEDLQLGVESYQKKLNLTKPDTYRSNLRRQDAYTPYSDPRGFIYENKDKKNRLMRIDELHKFSDGTLDDVRTALNDRLKGIRMEYLPQTFWSQRDKANARAMIQAIDKRLKTRRIMRSLERFVGGRPYGGDLRLLQRTI
ncbi:putative ribonuclease H-like domain-containing protein [Tanacetum coccineum]